MNKIIDNKWYIKSRYLFFVLILSYIISGIILANILPDYFADTPDPMSVALYDYIFYGILFLFLYIFSKKASINLNSLFGELQFEYFTSKYIFIVLPMIAISYTGIYLTFYPLSFWKPEIVKFFMVEIDSKIIWLNGESYKLANILSFVSIAIVVPIVEELFIRGFLFTSMANKWGIKKAILLSSIFFGMLHANVIGTTLVGIVLCVIYLKTKSLFAPIIIHSAINIIGYILSYFTNLNNIDDFITQFQGSWGFGLICIIIGIPWIIYFYKKEISNKLFSVPYFQKVRV